MINLPDLHGKRLPIIAWGELLGAEYQFSVTIGNVAEDGDPSLYRSTGLQWPKDSDR